jgi:hypothetical protein
MRGSVVVMAAMLLTACGGPQKAARTTTTTPSTGAAFSTALARASKPLGDLAMLAGRMTSGNDQAAPLAAKSLPRIQRELQRAADQLTRTRFPANVRPATRTQLVSRLRRFASDLSAPLADARRRHTSRLVSWIQTYESLPSFRALLAIHHELFAKGYTEF